MKSNLVVEFNRCKAKIVVMLPGVSNDCKQKQIHCSAIYLDGPHEGKMTSITLNQQGEIVTE